ncbi:MAG TPA: GDP-L-fucose synthase [Myxococcota bacterium]|nr:GDP-L-fucose synthase [Myxococcota bacterium]
MPLDARIYVAGHRGLVGSAIVRALERRGFAKILTRGREELDLRDQAAVGRFFRDAAPEYVFLAAARVGGIVANSTYPADFILENLQIATSVIDAALRADVRKLVYLGSSCIYPKLAPQPLVEDALMQGPLEPTNEPYAVAKIAGVVLCRSVMRQYGRPFIALMPTNLYGPNDHYHPENSHVLPGMIRRFHEAKVQNRPSVTLWGTGSAKREFLHVDDMAEATLLAMERYDDPKHLNVGSGSEIAIRDLAALVRDVVGYTGDIQWDSSRPDGTPRKIMDSSRMRQLGWAPRIELREGATEAYRDFLARDLA